MGPDSLIARKDGASGLTPRPFEILSVRRELDDCVTLEMRALDGGSFAFEPGQFTMLYVHGVGEIAISISGDPAAPDRLVQTVRGVGAVSRALCGLAPGAWIGVRGPFGAPWPVSRADGRHLMIIAGGLGLAPVRPILHWARAQRDRLKRVAVIYGARSPEQILYARQLEEWAASAGMDVFVTVDRAAADWTGRVGMVTDVIDAALTVAAETTAMICGPEIMMRFSASALATAGVPEAEIFLSAERNMKCGVGWCGHCQMGPYLVCRDGPVFPYPALRPLFQIREL